jgi:hypothetical protein
LGQRLSSFYPAQYLCGLARSVRQRTQASRLGARLYVMPASGSGGIVRGCAPVCLHRVCGGMARHGIMATCKKKNGERSRGRAAERHPRTRVFIADDRTTANVRRDLACARARRSWGATSRAPSRCCLRWRLALAAQAKKVCILGVRIARPKLCISVARPSQSARAARSAGAARRVLRHHAATRRRSDRPACRRRARAMVVDVGRLRRVTDGHESIECVRPCASPQSPPCTDPRSRGRSVQARRSCRSADARRADNPVP